MKKILIANRGEIAARVIRACKKLAIKSVAVYSEADQHAAFVKLADESYLLGKPKVSESYLNVDKIIEIAHKAEVDAVHPGYGLLSEHAGFAERCRKEGLTFIGPANEVIEKMGDKIEAREAMEAAGVPIIPGTKEAVTSVDSALTFASDIGYPLMLKASAGGGGIGMQLVTNDEELKKSFESNSKRAFTFFGDGTMFIEKKIENPRHIEIQILADSFGNTVHLFERECSIQRRHQKVVEEAPSPYISEKMRKKMGATAVKAAKAIGYENAGTMEFLVDDKEQFYFLEMNTRLQVEHPITEEITGIDIVEQQIKIASGQELKIKQEEITRDGHAIEVRIYAEDPVSFYPSPGQITNFEVPEGANIRHELAVAKDSVVSPFYDPMIGKLIITGATRKEAISLLSKTLQRYKVEGIKTNVAMLRNVVDHEKFIEGHTLTTFIEEYYLPMTRIKK